jgi:hypothetical protein
MQDSTRMRIESNDSRHRTNLTRSLDNRAHDQLMTEMQTIKNAEREHRRPLNVRVVSSVKETHHSTTNPS